MMLREQCILGIEGTGHSISVGVTNRGVPVGELFDSSESPASQTLLCAVDRLLDQCRIEKEELQGICLTLGPGSFTSMRVSLAVAEALGLALKIPLYGIDVLILKAATVPFYPFPIRVVQSAYKGELYTASFRTSSGFAERLDKLRLVTPKRFLESLNANDLVLGSGLERLSSERSVLKEKKVRWDTGASRRVGGNHAIEHFLDATARGPSAIPLEPLYLRLSDAELNYGKQFGSVN